MRRAWVRWAIFIVACVVVIVLLRVTLGRQTFTLAAAVLFLGTGTIYLLAALFRPLRWRWLFESRANGLNPRGIALRVAWLLSWGAAFVIGTDTTPGATLMVVGVICQIAGSVVMGRAPPHS